MYPKKQNKTNKTPQGQYEDEVILAKAPILTQGQNTTNRLTFKFGLTFYTTFEFFFIFAMSVKKEKIHMQR